MKSWLKWVVLLFVIAGIGGIVYDVIRGRSTSKEGQTTSSGRITAVGSTALQPLAEKISIQYKKNNPKAYITVQGGGSGTGLSQIQAGTVQIGDSDIFAEQKSGIDAKKILDHQVAVVGIAPVVNKDLKVDNLKMSQLQDIFTGKITNWKEVGGPDQKIVVINRAAGSGTRATFEADVFEKGMKAINAEEQDSNGAVQKVVAATPGAISYLALPYINSSLHAVKIDNVAPTVKNIVTNDWKIWSYEHMYTGLHPDATTKKFLNYAMSKDVQNKIVKDAGYISIHDMKVTKDAKGKITPK